MIQGDTSVLEMYGTCSWFIHNAPAVDSMPCNCLHDLTRLLHFVNDWELDDNNFEWDEAFAFPKHDMITATMIMLLLIVSIDCRYYTLSDGRIVSSLANGLLQMNRVLTDGIIHLVKLDQIQNQSVPVLHSTLLL